MADFQWCFENPHEAAAEINRLTARLADAEARIKAWEYAADVCDKQYKHALALLDEVAFYPLQFAAKEPTARSVYERIKAFRAADSASVTQEKNP